jgi:hypothetical protein
VFGSFVYKVEADFLNLVSLTRLNMKKFYCTFLAAIIGYFVFGQVGRTTVTVQLTPSKDATLFSENPNNANSKGTAFFAGRVGGAGSGGFRRALIGFDLSSIPAGSTINSVNLRLTVNKVRGTTSTPFSLHRLNAAWNEGTSAVGATVPDGQGEAATPGDPTWANRIFPGTPWATPGGDFNSTASATTNITTVGNYTWTSAQLAADVQAWVNSAATNFGWLLKSNEVTQLQAKRIGSRESPTVAERPVLTVVYTTTTPVTLSNLRASEVKNGVQVKWETLSEFNNSHFLVEHSIDGVQYSNIGKINGAGTSNLRRDYSLMHQGVNPGRNFYRLVQVDLNGQKTYSDVVQVNVRVKHNVLVITPNPVTSGILSLKGFSVAGGMKYEIVNASGARVAAGNLSSPEINVTTLSAGHYTLTITSGTERYKGRFLIK